MCLQVCRYEEKDDGEWPLTALSASRKSTKLRTKRSVSNKKRAVP